jgi:tetratricopeptide (TPR) repeat protein
VGSNAFTAKSCYDVFLSYNSADHGVVEDIARKLRDEGLEPFLDRWYLAPGARWRSKLEEALSACRAVAIFVGPGEMGSWQQREVDVALDLQSRSPNLPVIPVLLPGCEPPLGFLRQLTWVDLRTQAHNLGIAILAKAARGEAPEPDLQKYLDAVRASICPYRGLLHFREEDAPLFFGREAAIGKLMDAVQRQPLVAVVGASGSGKSSVVCAGLVPRLRSDLRTAWETVILVPTDQPLKALARALVPLLEPTMGEVDRLAEATKLAEHFRSGAIHLNDIVERILKKQSGTNRVLIVIDQFEELYTLSSDEKARRRFLDELLAASSSAGSKAHITLTLRGDFVGNALAYRPLSDRLQDAQINLGPMTREELECAIRKPAEKIELEFEPGLVKRILNDVRDEPGNLPLLEFVLKELWDKRRGRILLNETYDAMGGLEGAVATKADELLKGLSSAEQKILQRVFLRIVRPSESGLDTRRRAAFTELPPEGVELVVKLANERLLVTNQSAGGLEQTVEVAHEALISHWSTLRAWINEDREFLLWRQRLDMLLTEWERAEESDEALLRGPLLTEAQKWFDQRSQDLSDQERKFISASRALRERLVREERERQERDLEAAREAARKLRRRAMAAAGAAAAAVILLAASVLMWRAAVIATQQVKVEKQQTEKALARAEDDEKAAKEAKQRAIAAKEAADGLINYMQYDLSEKLGKIGRLDIMVDINARIRRYHEDHPAETGDLYALREAGVVALIQQGDVQSAQGDLAGAIETYRRSLANAQQLANQNQRDLSVIYLKVGDVQRTQGDLAGALKSYRDSLAIGEKLAKQDPANPISQRDLSVGYLKVGDVQSAQGDRASALENYLKSLAIIAKLTEQDPGNADWQSDLSISYDRVGDMQSAQGDLSGALKSYREMMAIAEKLAEQDPGNADWQRNLSAGHQKVGGVLSAQNDHVGALESYRKSLAIVAKLTEQDSSHALWLHDLSVCHEKVGHALSAQNDHVGAIKNYRKSLAIIVKLTKQYPSHALWLHDLSDCYDDVGSALSAQGDISGALESYRESLAIREKLGKQAPDNASWQGDLAYSYWKTGAVWSKVDPKSEKDGRAMVEKGRDILGQLKQRMGLTLDQQNWLNAIEADLQMDERSKVEQRRPSN